MRFIRSGIRDVFYTLILIAAIFVFALLVDQISPLKQFDLYLKEHPQPWTALTIGAAIVGLVLLLFAWVSWGALTGRPMSEERAREYLSKSAGLPGVHRVFRGKAQGIETPQGAASFREVKDAFRSGAWLRDPVMRVFCVGTVGLLLMTFGFFGYFVVTAPPAGQVICAGALLYVFGRTAWGFLRA